MSGETHRIGRACFRISGPDQAGLLQWRTRLEAAGTGELEEALDAALSGFLPEDELLVIDRLEVDLGVFAADDFDLSHLISATREALRRAAIQAVRRTDLPAPPKSEIHAGAIGARQAYRIMLSRSAAEVLMTYLATGRLSPAATFPDVAALYAAIDITQGTVEAFKQLFQSASTSLRRAVLLRFVATAPREMASALLSEALPSVRDLPEFGFFSSSEPALPGTGEQSGLLTRVVAELELELDARHPVQSEPGAQNEEPADTVDPHSAPGGLPCKNAGLVLLHPFLRPYFEGIGLMRNRLFVAPEARATAARLLHVIATGKTGHEEPDLVIPRLLCAVPDDQPVLPLSELDPEQIAEGERMLSAAIDAWDGIGHATPDGIRETFLQRNGVLTGAADALTITVERRGVDILLDRLPWALSLISLPWLPAPLKVAWI